MKLTTEKFECQNTFQIFLNLFFRPDYFCFSFFLKHPVSNPGSSYLPCCLVFNHFQFVSSNLKIETKNQTNNKILVRDK